MIPPPPPPPPPHTHTQTCKHRQTGSSHCSSFVYTLTFSQHLSYVLYTFGKRGPFSNWGPYCSFCYKSPVWMPKQSHTHTHTLHMALVGYLIVFSFVTNCGHANYRISLVGYHCSIEFPCGVPLFYCCKYPTLYTRTNSRTQSCVRCILRTSYCSPLLFPLLLDLNFFRHLPLDLYTFFNRGHLLTITANRGPIVPLCYKSSVYPLHIPTHTHTHKLR